ncbi:hypothetical protein RQP46_001691 [Phenoliferia psychrophenolica]
MQLQGKIVYITGCAMPDGIGNALVLKLLSDGASVFAVDRAVAGLDKQFGAEIKKGTVATCETDVTDWKAYRRSFELCGFWKGQEEGPYLPMEVNASAAFRGTRLAIDQFLRQSSIGLIVITGSVWAVEGFTRSLDFLDAMAGIRVVCLEPGVIKTSFWDQIGIDKNTFTDESATSIPSIVDAWLDIIHDPIGIPGGSAYEVTALGKRLYTLESKRTVSANAVRNVGLQEIVDAMRVKAKL